MALLHARSILWGWASLMWTWKLFMVGRVALAVASLLLLSQAGCSDRQSVAVAEPVVTPAPPPQRKPNLPTEASYSTIKDGEEYNSFTQKRMVELRLNKRVSPEVLREIALEVKAKERHQYQRTFIWVYLPEPLPGVKGALWATCHFDPTLNVDRTGMTKEEEDAMRAIKFDLPGKRIGEWLMDTQYGGWLVVIFEDRGKLKVAETHSSPEPFISEMVEIKAESGRQFKKVVGSEIYAVDESRSLRVYNSTGNVFAGAMPLK